MGYALTLIGLAALNLLLAFQFRRSGNPRAANACLATACVLAIATAARFC